jgi:uncharacterized protein YjbJ (UPF0337 family)
MDVNVWDKIAANLTEFRDNVTKEWPLIPDQEVLQIHGNRRILSEKIQENYGISAKKADQQIEAWIQKFYLATH